MINLFKFSGVFLLLTIVNAASDGTLEFISVLEKIKCPPTGDHYYPHETDCTKYYVCTSGVLYELTCPKGTYWNQKQKYCDFNSDLCNEYPPITTEPPMVTTEEPVFTTGPPVVTTEPPVLTTEPPVITTEPPVITTEPPVITTEPPVFTTGPPVITTKPPVVTTETTVVTTEPPITTTEPPVITTQPPVITTEPATITTEDDGSTKNMFPCPDSGLHSLPHYALCNLYYRCFNGKLLGIYSCTDTDWFDSRSQKCVDQRDSDCPHTEPPVITTQPPIITTEPATITTEDDGSTKNMFPCPDSGLHSLPHYALCNLYYRCFNGKLLGIYSCIDTDWFDSRSQKCVDQRDSDCPHK